MISNTVYQSAVAQHAEELHNGRTNKMFYLWLEERKQAGQYWEQFSDWTNSYSFENSQHN